jgi:dienelactone hydrolase
MLGLLILLAFATTLLGGCTNSNVDLSIPTTAPSGALEYIPANLYKPDGPGPFPAIVVMHDCSGLGPASSGAPARWVEELAGRG